MKNEIITCSAGLLILAGTVTKAQEAPKENPNIIFLLVDDLGWRDVGFNGSRFYETPNLDRLAAGGMIFNNAYAACAVSSPTRASIQTGRYPARIGITDWIRARFQVQDGKTGTAPAWEENNGRKLKTPSNPFHMELDEITIAELLKTRGYFTCHIGKWHLGPDDYYPEKQGYDLNIAGNDMGQPVNYFDPYDRNGISFPNLKSRSKGEYLEDRLSDELIQVIRQNKEQPFFINMCYYAVHTPLMAKPETIDRYETKNRIDDQTNAVYAAMIEHLDDAVGKLVNTLEEEELTDNTIIIFFSDNGGLVGPTSNSPLRSGKGYPYEGGIKEPMFVYWKNVIQPGTKCDVPVCSIDFLPALCALTGTALPDRIIDGRDISPLFYGRKMKKVPLYWHFPHYRMDDIVPYSIIRDGNWKLIKWYEGRTFELYNLKRDISESNDLASSKPSKVKKLNRKLEEWLVHAEARMPLEK
jgi:arylsulfatase A-like enzyme